MTKENIFSDQESENPVTTTVEPEATGLPDQPTIPPELAELVGEGKKYKSVDDAIKSLPHAQQHISTLEDENATMKAELAKRKTAEELLEDMRKNVSQPASTNQGVEVNANVLSEIVQQELVKSKKVEEAKQNATNVTSAFRARFGEQAETVYNKLAEENGMTVAELNAIAMKTPKMVMNLAGLSETSKPNVGKLSSDVNTQSSFSKEQDKTSSIKVPIIGATSKQLADAWAASKQKVENDLNIKG